MTDDNSWRTPSFRQSVVNKINEAIQTSGMNSSKNSVDMENHVFSKAKNKDEYLSFVARLILHVREMSSKNKNPQNADGVNTTGQPPTGNPGMQDPINALQNLASQGTQNRQMGPGMGPGPGQQQMNQQMMQQNVNNPGNMGASNLMQSLTMQRPQQQQQPQQMPPNVMQAQNRMPMPNQMGNMGMQNPGQMGNQMNMNPIVQGGPNQGVMGGNVMNAGNQMQMNPQNPQMNPALNQMAMNQGVMNQGQMNPGMMGNPAAMGNMNPGVQMNPNCQMSQGPAAMQPNQAQGRGSPMGAGVNQMNPQMMGIMQRNQPTGPGVFPNVRSVTPNFMSQSPSPSVPSPAGMSHQNTPMVPSPALVPSPSPQMPQQPPRNIPNVMAPSPSASINTPGQAQAVPSPLNPQEEQIYREKYRQLTKYIEPLKKMISKMGSDDGDRLTKLKKLLEILSNHTRIPLETLLKCEIALESQLGPFKDQPQMSNPLLDALQACISNPLGNHTLQRTFKPVLEAYFGPEIKNMPPAKRLKENPESDLGPNEIPHLLQGEIARLDQKFKISLDNTAQTGTKTIKLICCLDDKFLPCVPPISVTIPEDYPLSSPHCNIVEHEYGSTPFLLTVQKALNARISKLPKLHSLSHILDTWAMSVRQACSKDYVETSQTTVLMGM